jgi:hypothetical protein
MAFSFSLGILLFSLSQLFLYLNQLLFSVCELILFLLVSRSHDRLNNHNTLHKLLNDEIKPIGNIAWMSPKKSAVLSFGRSPVRSRGYKDMSGRLSMVIVRFSRVIQGT